MVLVQLFGLTRTWFTCFARQVWLGQYAHCAVVAAATTGSSRLVVLQVLVGATRNSTSSPTTIAE